MGAQDSEGIQSLRAGTDNSVNMLSDRETAREGDSEDFYGSNTNDARKWRRWMSLFLLPVVNENNLSKFGRICLEIVVPGPLSVQQVCMKYAINEQYFLTTEPGSGEMYWPAVDELHPG